MSADGEGATRLFLPASRTERGPARRQTVFYNPAMALDRDLEVSVGLALRAGGHAIRRAWEMTAATGVRGLRLLHEARLPVELLASESHPVAFDWLERNCAIYHAEGAKARRLDARSPVEVRAFDWVDLDPYGSPLPFLEAAVDAASERAVLAVTATDLRVLAGADGGIAERRYGGRPPRGRLGPEGGLRLLLATIDRALRQRGRGMRPILAYVGGHHLRAYVVLEPSASPEPPIALLDPGTWEGPPLPGPGPFGPMWLGPLFDPGLVRGLTPAAGAARPAELGKFIGLLRGEAEVDRPFYYESNELASSLGLGTPPPVEDLLAILRAAGFMAARTHARPGAFRTTAPWKDVAALVGSGSAR